MKPAPLEPTTADRLARLRLLMYDAQARAGDTSALGEHLAVIALDGVGELAIGLCLHELGKPPPAKGGLPAAIALLRSELGERWDLSGSQGFNELHRARNLAQHQGVLPASDELPRWAAETETFVRQLVAEVFGVELQEVSSALAVSDAELRELLRQASETLDVGDPKTSFDLSWDALRRARSKWSGSPLRDLQWGAFTQWDEFRKISSAIKELSDRLEIGTFTSDLSEWYWLCAQHSESTNRSPPTVGDARRALVFVTSWVLRWESYTARYPERRWREWPQTQTAPRTGVPGPGPRLLSAEMLTATYVDTDKTYWRFSLADLPVADDDYASAVSTASFEMKDDPNRVSMSLGFKGELSVAAPAQLQPTDVLEGVRSVLSRATQIAHERQDLAAARGQEEADLAETFEAAFREAGPPFGHVSARIEPQPRGAEAIPTVSVGLSETTVKPAVYERELEVAMTELRLAPAEGRRFFLNGDCLTFPAAWPPDTTVEWAKAGLTLAQEREAQLREVEELETRTREQATDQMRKLLSGDSAGLAPPSATTPETGLDPS